VCGVDQLTNQLQGLGSIHAGHHHVEQNEVGREALHLVERLLATGAAQHLKAADGLQRDLGHGLDRRVVLDMQDALELSHDGLPGRWLFLQCGTAL